MVLFNQNATAHSVAPIVKRMALLPFSVNTSTAEVSTAQSEIALYQGLLRLRIHMQSLMKLSSQLPPPHLYACLRCDNEALQQNKASMQQHCAELFLHIDSLLVRHASCASDVASSQGKELSSGLQNGSILDTSQSQPLLSPLSPCMLPPRVGANELTDTSASSPSSENNGFSLPQKRLWSEFSFQEAEQNLWERLEAQLVPIRTKSLNNLDSWKNKTRLKLDICISFVFHEEYQPTFQVLDQSLSLQMERAMQNMPQLMLRHRPHLSSSDIVGFSMLLSASSDLLSLEALSPHVEECIQNCYDDQGFYIHLLKEALTMRSTSKNDASLFKTQAASFRGLRKGSKADNERHMSKGKKLRYRVIPPLENFMAAEESHTTGAAAPSEYALLETDTVNQLMRSLFSRE
ncbi:hypothetical protein IE077_001411 [Cardiosporidium cionae]|uniref:Apoptosis-antagonizing transcription factor C-terminal domain-containing protein n=1 Tax=Cardiosporidium cionae TaxID=476202 RepID=A0ABQ7J5J3_9APIC|nr:hypothetical protein IE077_001411 [Cardiosporidium cionae]|eukprot:KAF8819210.1 hypothetical protein IE077_001411 [Cardiosporidium cionae]